MFIEKVIKIMLFCLVVCVIAMIGLLVKRAITYEREKNPAVMIDLEIECRVCKTINYVKLHNAKEE